MNKQTLIYRFLVVGTLFLSVVADPGCWCAKEAKGAENKPVEEIETEYEEAVVVRKQKVHRKSVFFERDTGAATSMALNGQWVPLGRGHRLPNGLLAPLIT
ncbi:MAG: hypothetical protein MK108_11245 [Mariniblastus sp.]|nr:hypothetical protein [Mariniblastus sp.]